MGYVVIDNGTGDVLVRPGDFMNALNGDIVRVKVVKENGRTGKKKARLQKWLQDDKQNSSAMYNSLPISLFCTRYR